MNPNNVHIHTQNTKGRDFLIGDLHGAFVLLDRALDYVHFDPSCDRLYSQGDLINRGPESIRSLGYLKHHWFSAVRGNHEDMFLRTYNDGNIRWDMADFHRRRNGMAWFFDQSPETLAEISSEFKKLPIAIEVPTTRGTVGIVHAEIPAAMDWPTFKQKLLLEDPDVIKSALWGRDRLKDNDHRGVVGIDRVFHGHTIQGHQPAQRGNCFYIDTGAVLGLKGKENHFLTMVNLAAETARLHVGATGPDKINIADSVTEPAVPFSNKAQKPPSP